MGENASSAALLVELANTVPAHQGHARWLGRNRGGWVPQPTESELVELCEWLREFWRGNPDVQHVFPHHLVKRANSRDWAAGALVCDASGHIVLNPKNLWLQVALAIERHRSRMGLCENGQCQAPFFLRSKKHQKCCSECADLERKRRWWREHGKEWKRKRRSQRRKPRG